MWWNRRSISVIRLAVDSTVFGKVVHEAGYRSLGVRC